ncbi:SecY-interacting protein Syd [Paenibacillus apiarius]|uniref:SecY-interacting protein Syd n=1 Tax=Paenibacillus apiarius TaxID=46240 RepID=UPI00197E5342|nr:SecY-interacting protein Syd [Paenibacillus apiarius]MBN3522642.1 SecY-interacting protein Syd [Paenibacillus apiarius]
MDKRLIPCYQSELDEDEYVYWEPKVKEKQEDFEAIEADIDLRVHSSIKEYFNSFWFLNLQGFYNSKLISLGPVEPDKDINIFY